jgi:energy-coupling factor transporter ATP-binding protein EcfA2
MEPDQGFAVCPSCGRRDDAASLQPLFVVTGASGSGKTTLFGPLARLLAGRCLVFDVDWLIDASAVLSGAATLADMPWAGFAQAWLAVSHGIAQSGLPTVLLGTLTPHGLEDNAGRKWVGPIHGLLLDCPDDVRRQRIEARPRWRLRDVAEQISWAQWLRENITEQIDTSRCSPEEAAQAVACWVAGLLES